MRIALYREGILIIMAVATLIACSDYPTSPGAGDPGSQESARSGPRHGALPASSSQGQTYADLGDFLSLIDVDATITFEEPFQGVIATEPEGGFPGVIYYAEATFGPVKAVRTAANTNKPGFTTVAHWHVHPDAHEFYSSGAHFGNALIPGLGAFGNDDGVRFVFDDLPEGAVTAVGAHFGGVQEQDPTACCVQQWVIITFTDGGIEEIDLNVVRGGPRGAEAFFGYASPGRPIRSIEFNALGNNPLLDNFMYHIALGDVSVAGKIEKLRLKVAELELGFATTRILDRHLERALASLESGTTRITCARMRAFVRVVLGRSHGARPSIPAGTAAELIADANEILAELGCFG